MNGISLSITARTAWSDRQPVEAWLFGTFQLLAIWGELFPYGRVIEWAFRDLFHEYYIEKLDEFKDGTWPTGSIAGISPQRIFIMKRTPFEAADRQGPDKKGVKTYRESSNLARFAAGGEARRFGLISLEYSRLAFNEDALIASLQYMPCTR